MKKKTITPNTGCKVFYQDLFGLRKVKNTFLNDNDIKSVNWIELKPDSKYHFFTIKDFSPNGKYLNCMKINEIFNFYSCSVKTHHDSELVNFKPYKKKNEVYDYRPFDLRNIEYDLKKVVRHRYNVMKHFIDEAKNENNKNKNLGICFSRGIKSNIFDTVFITKNIADIHLTGGLTYFAPLFIFQDSDNDNHNGNDFLLNEDGKIDNFTKEFRQYFKTKYSEKYTPEDILGYIYAILHSPAYRIKYIEFLKIDFPRVPFTDNEDLFTELSKIGKELIDNHLLKTTYAKNICKFFGDSDNYKVEKIEYDAKEMKVSINKERFFQPVPSDIWNFHIGGYQVLDKWLKERKKHEISLSGEDIQHFIKVVNVLDVTIKTMKIIDEKTKGWI